MRNRSLLMSMMASIGAAVTFSSGKDAQREYVIRNAPEGPDNDEIARQAEAHAAAKPRWDAHMKASALKRRRRQMLDAIAAHRAKQNLGQRVHQQRTTKLRSIARDINTGSLTPAEVALFS